MLAEIISEENFLKMYDFYYSKVYNYVYCRLLNKEITEDLVSEIFIKLFERRHKFDSSKASICTWVITIAQNCVIDYFRKNKNIQKTETGANYSDINDINNIEDILDVENFVIRNIELECMFKSIRELGQRDFTVIYLKYFMSMSHREISGYMNITEKNASVVLTRALKILKNVFEKNL